MTKQPSQSGGQLLLLLIYTNDEYELRIRDNWPVDNWPVDIWPVTFLGIGQLAGDFLEIFFNIVPNCIKCNVHKRTKSPLIPTQNF